MKKFYYKKEDTVDKTPIILERRNTTACKDWKEEVENRLSARTTSLGSVDLLKDASLMPRIQSREITKSLSEDVLSRSYVKNPGKVITERELAASRLYKMRQASVNSKDSPQQVPQKDDLSPVKLKDPKFKPVPVPPRDRHKRDSSCSFPRQVTQRNDLSPVALKDPKFKPVPVPPKDRRKRDSSCLCYVGVFMAISLGTIGILAAVTGLLYSEIFTDRNSTSHRLQESVIDITNLIQNSSSIHEYHPLTDKAFVRKIPIESDYSSEIRRSGSNLVESDSSEIGRSGSNLVGSDSSEIRRSGSNLVESENTNTVQFRQMDMTDLSRLLDNKKAEIKFQDRDTTIFELNASSPAEQENNSGKLEVIKEVTKEVIKADPKINISEIDGPDILNIAHASDPPSIIKNEKLEETESPLIFDDARLRENGGDIANTKQEMHDHATDIKPNHSLYTYDNVDETEFPTFDSEKAEADGSRTLEIMEQEIDSLKIMNKNLERDNNKNRIREDFEVFDEKTEVEEEKIKYINGLLNSRFKTSKDSSVIDGNLDLNYSGKTSSDGLEDHLISSVSGTKLESQPVQYSQITDAIVSASENISKPSVKLYDINLEHQTITVSLPKNKVVWKAGDPIKVSNVHNESELVGKEISNENLLASVESKVEHDVEAMLEVINEPGDNVQDPFTVNRNGDIDVVSETFSLGPKHDLNIFNVNREDGDGSVLLRAESQSSQEDQMPKETLRAKPLNVKVSLAEAMKHLQALDINNKLLTSRMKSPKPLAKREKLTIKREKFSPSKLTNKQREKENISVDGMQLLHNLRLALQGNLIGL